MTIMFSANNDTIQHNDNIEVFTNLVVGVDCTVVELSGIMCPHHYPRVYGLILERYRIVTEVAWSVSL